MKNTKVIVAFTGPQASGKGAACSYFIERYGAVRVRFSQPIRDILDRLNLPHTRANMQQLSLLLRKTYGQDILCKIVAYDVASIDDPLIVVDGVRRAADVTNLKEIPGFHLIAIDAPQEVRYERTRQRDENPDDATKTWEEFQKQERADAEVLIPEIMKQAEYAVDNSGNEENLHRQLDEIYKKITYEG